MGSSSSLKPVSVLIDSVSSQLLKDIAPEICLFSFCIISFSYSTRAFPSAQHVLISLLSFFASHCPTSLIPFATLCFKVLYKQSPISLLPFYLILNFNQLFFQPSTKPTFTLLNPRAEAEGSLANSQPLVVWLQNLICQLLSSCICSVFGCHELMQYNKEVYCLNSSEYMARVHITPFVLVCACQRGILWCLCFPVELSPLIWSVFDDMDRKSTVHLA